MGLHGDIYSRGKRQSMSDTPSPSTPPLTPDPTPSEGSSSSSDREPFDVIAEALDADILFLNSGISRGLETEIVKAVSKDKRSDRVILVLVTSGGDADVAFRISRTLQQHYEDFQIFVPGWCKSAGTLIAIGAHTIYMGDNAEFGPLDVQMGKKDELEAYVSGLDLSYAIKNMQGSAFGLYEHFLLNIIRRSAGRVTMKTASEIAATIVQPYISSFAAQIPPSSVGEIVRLMTIANDYGRRLNRKFNNLKENALQMLVSGYSSHSFVIDREEAESLFHRVERPPAPLLALEAMLGNMALYPLGDVGEEDIVAYLRSADDAQEGADGEKSNEAETDDQTGNSTAAAEPGEHPADSDGAAGAPISNANHQGRPRRPKA